MTPTNERMTVSTLVRLSGLTSIAAGLLWSIGTIANVLIGGSIEPANTAGATVALLTHVVMVFAFLGIYAGQAHRMGLIGAMGTVLGIVGTTLLVGVNTVAFAKMVGAVEVLRPPIAIGMTGVISLLLGVVLIGVATLRTRRYHTLAGAAFILALFLLPLRLIHTDLAILAILAASVGFIWLGWNVWSAGGQSHNDPGRRVQSSA